MNPDNGLSPNISATDRSTRMIIDGYSSYNTTPSHTPPNQQHKLEEPNLHTLESQHQKLPAQKSNEQSQDVEDLIAKSAARIIPEVHPLSHSTFPEPSQHHEEGGGEKTIWEPPGPGFLRRKSSDFYNRAVISQFAHQHPHHNLLHHFPHHHGCWCEEGQTTKENEDHKERGASEPSQPPLPVSPDAEQQTHPAPVPEEPEPERFSLGRRWSWNYEDAKQRMQMEWMKRSEAHQDQ